MRLLGLVSACLSSLLLGGATAEPAPLWLVSGPAALHPPIAKLAEHRAAQGLEVVLSTQQPEEAIARCSRPPNYLLILGDAVLADGFAGRWNASMRSASLYRWRSVQEESFAADPLWADTSGNGLPEFPVGRIPARDPAQVREVVHKILAFESRDLSPADLGLPIWGGTPAYGKLLDEGATTLLLSTVRKYAPTWGEPWMIFGNPRSPLSADGVSQPRLFNARLARGGYVTTMIGHGDPVSFLSQNDAIRPIEYNLRHVRDLDGTRPSPPHIILACDCGQFAGGRQSLAESLLFASGGPVSVVAATTESHPLTNYYSALALLDGLERRHLRFGDYWHAAQLSAFHTRKRFTEALLKNAEGALEAEIDIPKLKRDQLLMYALLGDPATRLPELFPLRFEVRPDGDAWAWEVAKPAGATALHLGLRRPNSPARVKAPEISPAQAVELFEKRNAAWEFEALATLPADAPWRGRVADPGTLRLVAVKEGSLGVAAIELER